MSAELTESMMPAPLLTMLEQGRLVHALCLEGGAEPALALARTVAGAVLCERQQGTMCGECLACRKVLAGAHLDIAVLGPEDGGYKKDALRIIRAEVYRSPHEGRAKALIFRDAQLMSAEVQNLLLKVIEEPPDDSYFIFLCENRYRMLGTVLSRSVCFALPHIGDAELLDKLLDTDTGRSAKAVLEAACAGGGYRLLAALNPCEKNRQEYTAVLDTAATLLGLGQVREELGISTQRRLRLGSAIARAAARNESNGYLPLISAALCEQLM